MQKLHLVGFTPDFDGLIFSTRKGAKSGGFVVPLDASLVKQIADAERHRDGPGPGRPDKRLSSPRLVRPESALSPREMQDRIRAGWSLDEVAAEAGVDHDWVSRFASPVLAEMHRILDRARAATFDKPRVGMSGLPLGAAVRRNVVDRSVRLEDDDPDDGWSAFQLDEEQWVVRFVYRSRGREQAAEWLFDAETGELASRNRLASQLGYVTRPRQRRVAAPAPASSPTRSPRPAATPARTAKRPTAKRPAAKRPAGSRPTAKRAAAKRPSATRAAAKRVAAKPAPAKRATPTRATSKRAAPKARPAKRAKHPAPVERPLAERPAPVEERRPISNGAPLPRAEPPAAPARPFAPRPEPGFLDTGPVQLPVDPPDWIQPRLAPEAELFAEPVHPPAELEPPAPGAVSVDSETGIARIDSRRTSAYVSGSTPAPPRRGPVFRDDVARAGPDDEEPPPTPRRRGEPLRAR